MASDGKWYPPELHPSNIKPETTGSFVVDPSGRHNGPDSTHVMSIVDATPAGPVVGDDEAAPIIQVAKGRTGGSGGSAGSIGGFVYRYLPFLRFKWVRIVLIIVAILLLLTLLPKKHHNKTGMGGVAPPPAIVLVASAPAV